ncbi:hypothetical protein FSP39_004499 [Pinctada imbricata]|uniref:Zinc transporter ZIP14 n=1 Tax=Pinctada imbricata TaxID=66713 RepID=A0AA88XHS8_PINIB|nr:hypothetical protein FSP39_004499 [Pinctada imbricata]
MCYNPRSPTDIRRTGGRGPVSVIDGGCGLSTEDAYSFRAPGPTSSLLGVRRCSFAECYCCLLSAIICFGYDDVFDIVSKQDHIDSVQLGDTFPLLLYAAQQPECGESEEEGSHERHKPTIGQAWGYGIGFCSLIVLISNIGLFLGPFTKTRIFKRLLMFCVALAVGTLAATGFLVLLPESMHLTADDSPVPDYNWKMATVMGGAYFVFITEKVLNATLNRRKKAKAKKSALSDENDKTNNTLLDNTTSNGDSNFHGHAHFEVSETEDGRKTIAPVAWILLIGDALHNFVDGLSIGAAFTESTFLGISVSLAILCEELPHELGDIAILLHSGLNMKRAILYNFVAAVICYIGLIIGVVVGENTNANQWIFGFAAGLFIYISLSDMIPEMSAQLKAAEIDKSENMLIVFILQNTGLLTGFGIIMIIVVFGGNINV